VRHTHHARGIAALVAPATVHDAANRAAETLREHPLVDDPLAAVLVSTPEIAEVVEQSRALTDLVPDLAAAQRRSADFQAGRTHFVDAFCTEIAEDGVRQVVILGAGLDTRAFRLGWPADTVIFEIDRPPVLLYKAATLAGHGAQTRVDWRPVGVERGTTWARALWSAGFNHNVPTAWLAEGLFPLPARPQDGIITELDGLSAPGSRLVFDHPTDRIPGECHPADWLTSRGWWTDTLPAAEYLEALHRPVDDDPDGLFPLRGTFTVAEKIA